MISKWIASVKPFLFLVGVLWGIQFLDMLLYSVDFVRFGIYPRDVSRWYGILAAPFLHSGILHLLSNSAPLILLPILIQIFHGKAAVWKLMAFTAIFSGVGVWLLAASNTVTVGASGVVFGLIGFLVAGVFVKPSIANGIATALTVFLYGGVVLSLLVVMPGVSWLAHFFGFVSGGVFAYIALKGAAKSADRTERSM